MARIAVIGAGLAGLVVAGELHRRHQVTVFEKSRGVGGRMATRYADPFRFDHGAQFFTARSRAFQGFLRPHIETGVIATWRPQFVELRGANVTASRQWDDSPSHYVAVPGMHALAQALAKDLRVEINTSVAQLEHSAAQWSLRGIGGRELGQYDWLVVTAPAAQTAALIGNTSELGSSAANARMLGCFALMLGFEQPLPLPWQAALVREADISWISVNSSKPGRAAPYTVVVHSTNQWAETHMDDDLDAVREYLVAELSRVTGVDCSTAKHCALHRWRYANIDRQDGPRCFINAENSLGACGDWFIRGRVEAAFQSAQAFVTSFNDVV